MKKYLLLSFFLTYILNIIAQFPQGIQYQAVLRTDAGQLLNDSSATLNISIIQADINGTSVYVETHNAVTNQLGLIQLVIGNGNVEQGVFSEIDWSNGPYFLEVRLNNQSMGRQQFLTVPYAYHAQTVSQVKVNFRDITDAPSRLSDLVNDQNFITEGDLLDNDPVNEIQTLTFDPSNNEISISGQGGNSITIPAGGEGNTTDEIQVLSKNGNTVSLSKEGGSFTDEVNDADSNPTNEIQTLSKNGNIVSLSRNGGTFTDEVDDADSNPTNEIQTLSFNEANNQLSISGQGGNTVTIPTGGGNPTDEIQVLSKNGNVVTLSNGGGSFTDEVNDNDSDPNNELQTIVSNDNGNILSTGNDGGAFLAGATDNDWTVAGNNMSSSVTGNVGIGTANPTQKLDVNGNIKVNGASYYGPDNENYFSIPGNSDGSEGSPFKFYIRNKLAVRFDFDDEFVFEGEVFARTAMFSPAFNIWSDIRLKKDITFIKDPIALLSQLSGVYFYWKPEPTQISSAITDRQVGLIAQEVEKVLPEAISTNQDGIKAVNYSAVIPLLLEAIKEQQKSIHSLEDRIAEMKRTQDKILEQLAKIEKQSDD